MLSGCFVYDAAVFRSRERMPAIVFRAVLHHAIPDAL